MSQENAEVIREAVAAQNERDLDRYLALCREDVQLLPPSSVIEGSYDGPNGIRRYFTDVQDAIPDFRLEVEEMEAAGPDRVIVSFRATASGRASGLGTAFGATTIYDLTEGKIRRIRVFLNRADALEAAGLRE
jgi:ketosteroid isomerase-like protein